MAKFDSVRRLFSGTALATPREDDAPPAGNNGRDASAGPTEEAVDALVAQESATAASAATKAANDRWNAVMTSDEGKSKPAAAARLLSTTTMSAADVTATLADLGAPAAAAAPAKPVQVQDANRERLAADPDADPDTGGGAAASNGARTGEDDDKGSSVKAKRAARAQAAKEAAASGRGKLANAAA